MTDQVWTPIRHVRVADQWVAAASRQDFVDAAHADADYADAHGRVRTRLIFDSNGQGVSMARTDPEFRAALDHADVIHADGQFIVEMSKRYCAEPIPERTPTTDMIHDFAKACEESGRTFYLLGAPEEINSECTRILRKMYPKLNIVGRNHGFFKGREDEILADISEKKPDFLWVGLGKPLEQKFCVEYKDRLDAVWTITCGGCFNFITGDYPRAPQWMQDNSLEWLHRMIVNPRHLFWRYATTTPHAFVLGHRLSDKSTKTMAYGQAA
ncbi:WecB/TagA/CpsF family glycosyltransferase [Qipengyuania vesicularis]|uniref:WecB/TagA/CpsF family glycosyltransferase n=1 Tax=Qipengyuania vesicularis TaxID=2867232 RepID=UPI001C87B2E9|nr:WecB/TagA/CpsF family glycosyltransferase [Qipengyuania vesicularis]MBX7526505.1 WecB/TagA/CpsF family glycosyltransferase [Qipengyuania vesicularis]